MLFFGKFSAFSGLVVTALTAGMAIPALADPASDEINLIVRAMGGSELLRNASNQVVVAKVTGYLPLQAPTPGGPPEKFDRIESVTTLALDGSRYQTQWRIDIDFPLQTQYNFSEIINGEQGAVIGVDSLLQVPRAPMQAIRLAARKVEKLVTSPLELVKTMLLAPQDVVLHGRHNSRTEGATVLGLKKYGKEILLWVDNKSHLPLKATYWDSNPSWGDTEITTNFTDWRPIDGISVPMRVTQFFGDIQLGQTDVQSVNFNVAFFQDPFSIPPDLSTPLDNKLFDIGLKYSNWFHRYLLVGIPFDLNQYTPDSVSLRSVGKGIYYLRGFSHHSLIVEMADYLVVFDPVLLEERTQLVLPLIKKQWPNKKIKFVIPTHFHVDHSGGVRGYVADGAQLVTTRSNRKFYKDVLNAKHLIYPDLLSLIDNDARLVTVGDGADFVLDDKQRRIRLMQIDNRHAPGLIVPYIEDEKLLFVSDLYSPGLFIAPIPPQFSYWGLDLYNDLRTRHLDIKTIVGAHGDTGSYEEFLTAIKTTFPGSL